MMKHGRHLMALLMAAILLISSFAFAETAQEDDPVLFTCDGVEYRKSRVDAALENLLANGYLDSERDYDTTIEYLIQDYVIEAQIKKRGLDQYTDEEKAAFAAEAKSQWDDLLDDYVSYYLTEDTDEAREKARKDAEALYASYDYSEEAILQNLLEQDSYNRLQAQEFANVTINVTDAQIEEVFKEYAAQDQSTYEGNIYLYELYKNYGQESWYHPEGYRGIIHILLTVDASLLSAYQEAQNAYEEGKSAENANAADVEALKNAADAALKTVLDSEKPAIDDIYARLAKGESFESLIAAYGEDDGMKDEEYLKNGYEVHIDSIMWDPVFVSAAFQEKMQKPGDVSDPVVGENGIHILYYLRDIPGGFVELSDDIRTLIKDYLVEVQQNEIFGKSLEGWIAEYQIVYNNEAIEAAKAVPVDTSSATQTSESEDLSDDDDSSDEDDEEMTDEEWQQLIQMLTEQGFTVEDGGDETPAAE